MRWAGHVAHMGEWRGVYRVLVANPERKRTLVNPSHKWEDNIKVDIQEVGYACMDRIELVQVRDSWRELVGAVMNRRYP